MNIKRWTCNEDTAIVSEPQEYTKRICVEVIADGQKYLEKFSVVIDKREYTIARSRRGSVGDGGEKKQ